MIITEKELIDEMVSIAKRGKSTLDSMHEYVKDPKCKHKDRGLEGWFRIELVASLQKKPGLNFTYETDGADLIFDDKKVELKTTTSFNTGWIIDEGLIKHKAPVLFFSGYNKMKKINYNDEEMIKDRFQNHIESTRTEVKRTEKISNIEEFEGMNSIEIRYKVVQLKEKCIVGYIQPSWEFSCKKL